MNIPGNQESLYPFPDDIVIQDRLSAIQYSRDTFDQELIERCLVMWVDGSVQNFPPVQKANRLAVAAIGYIDPSSKSWTELVTLHTLPCGSKFALEAEMIAVHEAFRVACGLVDDFDHLLIFSDCQCLLRGIRSKSMFSFLSKPDWVENLLIYANMLYDLGITVELQWVPAHSSVEGNERVDKLARRVRRSAQYVIAKERPDLILQQVSITPSPEELIRQILLTKHYKTSIIARKDT